MTLQYDAKECMSRALICELRDRRFQLGGFLNLLAHHQRSVMQRERQRDRERERQTERERVCVCERERERERGSCSTKRNALSILHGSVKISQVTFHMT